MRGSCGHETLTSRSNNSHDVRYAALAAIELLYPLDCWFLHNRSFVLGLLTLPFAVHHIQIGSANSVHSELIVC